MEYAATFTVTAADEGLVNGKVYRFVFGASNAFGDSVYSLELIAGLGAVPPAPSQLTTTLLKETFEAFVVSWDAVTASDLPVLGYVLLMDDGLQGDFEVAYDGSINPQVTTFQATGLVPARTYRFKAYAVDVNGPGVESSATSQIACVAPLHMGLPVLEGVGRTTFTLAWDVPAFIGGCPIEGYEIYRDDGAHGDIDIPVDAGPLAGGPDLFRGTATLDSAWTGSTFHVKVVARNQIGTTESNGLQFVLADVPAKPYPLPTAGPQTTITQIEVSFENENPDDGGSPILFYELQMDDGRQGEFFTVLASASLTSFIADEDIQRGYTYRFQYRVANINGFSEYSDTAYIFAFSKPDAPPTPAFVSATDTSVILAL